MNEMIKTIEEIKELEELEAEYYVSSLVDCDCGFDYDNELWDECLDCSFNCDEK